MAFATFFEIPVTDLDRAMAFYGAVFGVALERTEIDGNEMAFFPGEAGAGEAIGALARGEGYVPSLDGTRVYVTVDDIAATLARAVAAGGAELYPVTDIGDGRLVAEFRDSEGNRIALSSF